MLPTRRPLTLRATRRKAAIAAVTVGLFASACGYGSAPSRNEFSSVTPPGGFVAESWKDVLGSDAGFDLDAVITAGQDSDVVEPAQARSVAFAATRADVTGQGRDGFTDYFPPLPPAETCTDFVAHAALVADLPVDNALATGSDVDALWAKALVVWDATCPNPPATVEAGDPYVTSMYLVDRGDGWEPVREGQIPQGQVALFDPGREVPSWALEPTAACTASPLELRLEVAAAWENLCQAAQAAFVPLLGIDGFRTAQQQQDRFGDAVDFYGSETEARKYVAYADDTSCESKHCAGTAVDIVPTQDVLAWLAEPVPCDVDAVACPAGSVTARSVQFGFVATLPSSPGHFEFTLPLIRLDDGGDCAAPVSAAAVAQVAAAWRCELAGAAVTGDVANDVIAQALTTAGVCSGFDPGFFVEGGRFRNALDPRTGTVRTEAGLFALPDELMSGFSFGPERLDTVRTQALIAARVFVAERNMGRSGWAAFGCRVAEPAPWAAALAEL